MTTTTKRRRRRDDKLSETTKIWSQIGPAGLRRPQTFSLELALRACVDLKHFVSNWPCGPVSTFKFFLIGFDRIADATEVKFSDGRTEKFSDGRMENIRTDRQDFFLKTDGRTDGRTDGKIFSAGWRNSGKYFRPAGFRK